jgi:catechol 2,3-dioxygenase
MKAKYLGHAALYVKDIERSLKFYRDLLGFEEVGRMFNGKAAALTGGRTHHELLLLETGGDKEPPQGREPGLFHLGFKIGDCLDELRAAKRELEAVGVDIEGQSDHGVSQSLYLKDPDGNEIEVYVDADPRIWKENPASALIVKPLAL